MFCCFAFFCVCFYGFCLLLFLCLLFFYVLLFYVAPCKMQCLCSVCMVYVIDCNWRGWSGHWDWPRRISANSILLVRHRWTEADLRSGAIHGNRAFGRQRGSCRADGENSQGLRSALGGNSIDNLLMQHNFCIHFHQNRVIWDTKLLLIPVKTISLAKWL